MNTDCPICENSGVPLLEGVTDFHVTQRKPFDVQYCGQCTSGFSVPPMSEQELAPFYPDHYEAYVSKSGFLGAIQRLKYHMDLKLIARGMPAGGHLFEIGAGRGEFLAVAKKKGFVVSGIEPSDAARKFAAEAYGINLQGGTASSLQGSETYDRVVARHVLEHVNQPTQVLTQILTSLKPQGILFLKLPNFNSWERKLFGRYWASWDLPRHRFHFSRQGLEQLLKRMGYTDIESREEVVPATITLSLKHVAEYGDEGILKQTVRMLLKLPGPLVIVLAQIFAIAMAPFHSGRMIVTARKP